MDFFNENAEDAEDDEPQEIEPPPKKSYVKLNDEVYCHLLAELIKLRMYDADSKLPNVSHVIVVDGGAVLIRNIVSVANQSIFLFSIRSEPEAQHHP